MTHWDIIIDELIGYGVVNRENVEKCDCPNVDHHEAVCFSDKFIKYMKDSYSMIKEATKKHPDVVEKFKDKVSPTDIRAIMVVALIKYFGSGGRGVDKQVLDEYAFALSAIPQDALNYAEAIVKGKARN